MTNATQSTTPTKTPPIHQATANEWGQITDLEPHATYFVVRKPTPEYTREQSRRMIEDVRHFLHEQRVLAERQVKELNDKYGEPARGRVQEIRGTLEKRFDELTKELETRIERIETDLNERGILKTKKDETAETPAQPVAGETPGEMPTGEHNGDASPKAAAPKKKTSTKKDE